MLSVLLWVSPVMGATYSNTYKYKIKYSLDELKVAFQKIDSAIGALDPNDPYFTAI